MKKDSQPEPAREDAEHDEARPEGWALASLDEVITFALGGQWGDAPANGTPPGFVRVNVVRGTDFRNWNRDRGSTAAERVIPKDSLVKRQLREGDIVVEISGGGPDQPVGRTLVIDARAIEQAQHPVLAAACSGRLTEEWRQSNSGSETDLPSVVLAYHRRSWEQKQIARIGAKKGTRDRWKADYHSPDFIAREEPSDLPMNWAWIPLGLLGEDPLNTVQTGPFGAQLHRNEFTETGIPVIAVGNLTGMGFTEEGLYHVTEHKAKQLSRFDVQAGDVLFARSGATLGKVCLAPDYVKDWRMTGHILRARLNTKVVLPRYAVYALHGDPRVAEQVFGNIRGVTRPGFNTTLLEVVQLPLPPLEEQREILRRVEALFKLADAIEKRVEAATKRADRLTQSILGKAFRGELVPTEAELARKEGRTYEPASDLLARIKSERENSTATKPTGTNRKSRPAPTGKG